MDQFENNTPVQGDTQGETSHNEPEQAPIQEAPVQGLGIVIPHLQGDIQHRHAGEKWAEKAP